MLQTCFSSIHLFKNSEQFVTERKRGTEVPEGGFSNSFTLLSGSTVAHLGHECGQVTGRCLQVASQGSRRESRRF